MKENPVTSRVCALHFRKLDFTTSNNGFVLVRGAVPTQNLDPESAWQASTAGLVHPMLQKRKRGRPRKFHIWTQPVVKPKRKRGRPRKCSITSDMEQNQHGSHSNQLCNIDDLFIKQEIKIESEDYCSSNEGGAMSLPNCINEVPVVYTTKLDDMNVPMEYIVSGLRNNKLIDRVIKRSKPNNKIVPLQKETIKTESKDNNFPIEISETVIDYSNVKQENISEFDDDIIMLSNPNSEKELWESVKFDKKHEKNASLVMSNEQQKAIASKLEVIQRQKQVTPNILKKGQIRQRLAKIPRSGSNSAQALKTYGSPLAVIRRRARQKPTLNTIQPVFNHLKLRCIIITTLSSNETDVYITNKGYTLMEYFKYTDKVQLLNYKRTGSVVTVKTCCWFQRESTLMTHRTPNGSMTLHLLTYLYKRHECAPRSCKCCCKDKICVNEIIAPVYNDETTLQTSERVFLLPPNKAPAIKMSPDDINTEHKVNTSFVLQFKIKSSQDVELYEFGIKEESNEIILLRGYFKICNKDVKKINNLLLKQRTRSYLICCWAKRQICVETLLIEDKLPSHLAKFLIRPHFCEPLCNCCCQEELNRIIAKTRPKKLSSKCNEIMVSYKNESKIHHMNQQSDIVVNINEFKRNFKLKQLALKKPIINEYNEPITKRVSNSRIPILYEDNHHEHPKPLTENSVPEAQPDVNLLISTILERFKDVKLSVKNDGKVCATIDSSQKLTQAEIRILSGLITHAQKIVDNLGIAPGTNMPLGVKFQETVSLNPIVNQVNVPRDPPTCFQPVITQVVGNADIDKIKTATEPMGQIINVCSLTSPSNVTVMSPKTIQTPKYIIRKTGTETDTTKCDDVTENVMKNFGTDENVYVLGDNIPMETIVFEDNEPAIENDANADFEVLPDLELFQNTDVPMDSIEEETILGV